jgi:phenylacetic acid degradation operon negative regulatory protein
MTQERNAPFTARSVLASALLGTEPPRLPVAQLVRLAGLFGINDNRARVALSRMVAAGEATTDGRGTYTLAGHLLARQRRQAASRSGPEGSDAAWDGTWHLVVVTAGATPAGPRTERRRALAFARLAELREGVWTRPANLALDLPGDLAPALEVMKARPDDPAGLAARCWDLAGWAARAEGLLADLAALPPAKPDDLAPGFVLSAAVLRHLQADPLLPAPLGPDRWPGRELRTRYDAWDRAYRAVLADWSRPGAGPPGERPGTVAPSRGGAS